MQVNNLNQLYYSWMDTSAVMFQFDMVCDDAYLVDLIRSIFMSGVLVGSAVSGLISDR